MDTILVGEVNLHENLTTPKFLLYQQVIKEFCCAQEIVLCMWISCKVVNDGTI